MRAYQRDWHQKNKEERVKRVHERKEKLWAFYNQLKETIQCSRCRENHPATLQFHHLNPQQKDFNLSEAVRSGFSIERIQKKLQNVQSSALIVMRNYITRRQDETMYV